ncbi:MAG: cyclic lactone autoinducer peptide [Clostridia bacterium]
MKKIVKKLVEMYAKSSTNSCFFVLFHQPKMPRTMIQK